MCVKCNVVMHPSKFKMHECINDQVDRKETSFKKEKVNRNIEEEKEIERESRLDQENLQMNFGQIDLNEIN